MFIGDICVLLITVFVSNVFVSLIAVSVRFKCLSFIDNFIWSVCVRLIVVAVQNVCVTYVTANVHWKCLCFVSCGLLITGYCSLEMFVLCWQSFMFAWGVSSILFLTVHSVLFCLPDRLNSTALRIVLVSSHMFLTYLYRHKSSVSIVLQYMCVLGCKQVKSSGIAVADNSSLSSFGLMKSKFCLAHWLLKELM